MSVAGSASTRLPRPGDTIGGKYVLDRLLGQGGMGAVFAAKHIKLSKPVAIKIMLADASNPEAAQRFINEGRAAANIQNEHVVRVDDVDEEMGYAYMVLELLDGEDLAQLLEREPAKRLAPHVAVGYVVEALRGVMQAHAIGIVHRDLKPSNLFLAKRKDGSIVVKVLDFGISKAQGSSALAASPSALTSTKAMLGSPLYMSPEQLRSSKSVDHRADIWAVGVILYELMTGHLPFMGDNLGELFVAILETDPVPLRNFAPIPMGLEEVVLRCLQRRPEQRIQTAAELIQLLMPFTIPQPGFVTSAPLGEAARFAPGARLPNAPNVMVSAHAFPPTATPPNHPNSMPRPELPPAGAATRVVGTVALGAVTPQGMMQQTGSAWQSTRGGVAAPKSKAFVVVGAAAAGGLLLLGVVGAGLIVNAKAKSSPAASTVPASPPPLPSTVPSAIPAPTPAQASAQTSVQTEVPPSTATTVVTSATHAGVAAKPLPKPRPKVDPPPKPKVESPVPAPQPAPNPTPTQNSNNLQNAR